MRKEFLTMMTFYIAGLAFVNYAEPLKKWEWLWCNSNKLGFPIPVEKWEQNKNDNDI